MLSAPGDPVIPRGKQREEGLRNSAEVIPSESRVSLALGKERRDGGCRGGWRGERVGVGVGSFQGWKKLAWFRLSLSLSRRIAKVHLRKNRPRNGGMRRAILRKTSKLHFQRLKLFPYDVAGEKDPWLTGSVSISLDPSNRPAPSPMSFRQDQFLDCLSQTTNYIPTRVCCMSLSPADSLHAVSPPPLPLLLVALDSIDLALLGRGASHVSFPREKRLRSFLADRSTFTRSREFSV